MAGLIPRQFIDDLLARADIVDLIHSRVPLKKTGKNYSACCPFHTEKSPSFTVSQDKQFYHCFGCGAHGNAISFIMEYEKLEFNKDSLIISDIYIQPYKWKADNSEITFSQIPVFKDSVEERKMNFKLLNNDFLILFKSEKIKLQENKNKKIFFFIFIRFFFRFD